MWKGPEGGEKVEGEEEQNKGTHCGRDFRPGYALEWEVIGGI